MNLINGNFIKLLPYDKFFTENVSLFLYSLIKCTRPLKLIEVGFGYSTLFISRALQDIQSEEKSVNEFIFSKEYDTFVGDTYKPEFIVVDDLSHHAIENTMDVLRENKLDKNIRFVKEDVYKFIENNSNTYDFIWLDFGDGTEYLKMFDVFYGKLSPGGQMIIHSTAGNLCGRYFLSEIKLKNKLADEFEMITFVEPHKRYQSSFTVIKKNINLPIYEVFA
jgi:hypothetical protein